MSAGLNCRECSEFLADYLEGTLEAGVQATFDAHLGRCRNCREYLAEYEATIRAGQSACRHQDTDAQQVFPEELVRAILAARKKTPG